MGRYFEHWRHLFNTYRTAYRRHEKGGFPIIDTQLVFFTSSAVHKHIRIFPFVRQLNEFWPSKFEKDHCNADTFYLDGAINFAISASAKPPFDALWANHVAEKVDYLQHCSCWTNLVDKGFTTEIPEMLLLDHVKSFTTVMVYPDTSDEPGTPYFLPLMLQGLHRQKLAMDVDLSRLAVDDTFRLMEAHTDCRILIQPLAPDSDPDLLERAASIPHAFAKLSPADLCPPSDEPGGAAPEPSETLRRALETFGPDRCMFGSNFPLSVAHEILDPLTEEEQRQIEKDGDLTAEEEDQKIRLEREASRRPSLRSKRARPRLPEGLYERHVLAMRDAVAGLGYSPEDVTKVMHGTARRVYGF